jgi:integrase
MASVSRDAKGWRIDFRLPDGRRCALRAGTGGNKRRADEIAAKLRALIAARAAGSALDQSVARWLGELPDGRLRSRLVDLGLAERRERDCPIVEWVERYLERHAERHSVTPSTRKVWGRAVVHARAHFGSRLLSSLTPESGLEFREAIMRRPGRIGETLAEATVRKSCGVLAMALRAARKAGALLCDPFEGVPKSAGANPEREVYVERATVEKILEVGPGAEFRLLVALSRLAGLRVPSEVRGLRWGAVDWERRALRVDSPKTRRHGKPWRLVPLVPELLVMLECAYSEAPEGAEFILPTYRTHTSPSMLVLRACRAAGVEPWPRPFHAMRASCETDWAARFPLADVAAWLGHTRTVAAKHYLRPTDATFAAATKSASGAPIGGDAGGDTFRETVVTPVVTRVSASSGALSQVASEVPTNDRVTLTKRNIPRLPASVCEKRGMRRVDLIGLEPTNETAGKQADSVETPAAVVTPVVTFSASGALECPHLAAIAAIWDRLAPAMRGAVRSMAEAAAIPPTSPTSPTSRP